MGRAQQQAEAKVETWEHYIEEMMADLEQRIESIEGRMASNESSTDHRIALAKRLLKAERRDGQRK